MAVLWINLCKTERMGVDHYIFILLKKNRLAHKILRLLLLRQRLSDKLLSNH